MGLVLIAEKPDQARKLASPFPHKKGNGFLSISACKEFPQGAKVTWAIGHLVELKTPGEYKKEWERWNLESLPVVPERFEYKVSKDKAKQFKLVKELLQEANEIIIATDPAREGENIARLLITMAGCSKKPIKRLWTSSLTENAIKKGFSELRDGSKTINLFHEAQARQISDWLVGLNASRLYTLLLRKKGINEVFSVGRVQTPVLKLIYDRQKEIEGFKSESFFELEASFKVRKGNYTGKLKGRFKSKEELYKAITPDISINQKEYDAIIKDVTVDEKRTKPSLLHSLSTLQAKLNQKYKFSPSKVLETVQALYEKGYVSYPRTDSQYITEEEFFYIKSNIEGYKNCFKFTFEPTNLEPSKRYVNPDKVGDHYAIVPTENVVNEEVVKSTLAIFMKDYVYDETVITTSIGQQEFITKGKTEKNIGWKALYQKESFDEKKDDEDYQTLPEVEKGESAKADVAVKEGMTKPPRPYTQGQLITLMKTAGKHIDDKEMKEALNEVGGLGTEATRSGIIETLLSRKFIEVKKNNVFVTKKGEILCQVVDGTLLSKPEMTAKWEVFLNEIGKGNKSKDVFIENAKRLCNALIQQASSDIEKMDIKEQIEAIRQEDVIAKCPSCKKGSIVERKSFYGCTEYKNGCKQSFNKKILGKTISKAQIKQLCEKGKTNKIKGFKGKKEFDAYLVFKEGKIEFSF